MVGIERTRKIKGKRMEMKKKCGKVKERKKKKNVLCVMFILLVENVGEKKFYL